MAEHKQPSKWTCDICANVMPDSGVAVSIAARPTQNEPFGVILRADDVCDNCVQALLATARSLAPKKVEPA